MASIEPGEPGRRGIAECQRSRGLASPKFTARTKIERFNDLFFFRKERDGGSKTLNQNGGGGGAEVWLSSHYRLSFFHTTLARTGTVSVLNTRKGPGALLGSDVYNIHAQHACSGDRSHEGFKSGRAIGRT
ncbi:hypothetical protein IE53DRAFT_288100 [Violaceomyces palustris]|uniref:Uncharacterized protein n=1 Tax=Violaceomyces palustris TaxID=1673888 RepID=A0ACD0P2K4_9BASI|nr:hypothetical protein IE53DRAFT_288100 [Violaceomyces palustris]